MLQTLLICFREGLEAFLVVAIATLYLRRVELDQLISAVRAGLLLSVTGSAVLGVVLSRVGSWSSTWAGVMALLACAAVLWCVVHMRQAGKGMGREIQDQLALSGALTGARAWWSVFAFIAFMVSREGIEAATMIASLGANADGLPMAAGGTLGLALAGVIGLLWVRHGRKVNLSRFFNVTSWFLGFFALQLVLYAVHEFTEANLLPGIDNAYWHIATEDWAEGWISQVIYVGMVILPTGWLLAAHLADRRASKAASVTA